MNTSFRIALGAVCLIAIVGVAYYGYTAGRDRQSSLFLEEEQADAGEDVSAPVSGTLPTDSIQEKQKPEEKKQETVFAAPNLARPVSAMIPLSSSVEEDAKKNIALLADALRKNPDDYTAWLGLGLFRKVLGDYNGAEEIWLYVTLRWATDFVAYNNLGNLYHAELRDFPKADEYFLKAASLRPDFIQTYFNLYDLYRYSYKGQETRAPGALLQGLEKNPANLNLMLALARYYVEMGNKDSASKYYKMAIQSAETESKTALFESLRKEAEEAEIEI